MSGTDTFFWRAMYFLLRTGSVTSTKNSLFSTKFCKMSIKIHENNISVSQATRNTWELQQPRQWRRWILFFFSGVEFWDSRWVREKKTNRCLVFTFSIIREIRNFHVVVSQWWKRNVVVSLIETNHSFAIFGAVVSTLSSINLPNITWLTFAGTV